MMRWEIANPITSRSLVALLEVGVRVTGSLTLQLDSDDPDKLAAVEESAAEAGIVLVRLEAAG